MTLTILLSFFTIPIFLFISFKIAKIINLYDHPNQKRKIHVKPVLLVGGIFFEIIFLSYFILLSFFNILNIDNVDFNGQSSGVHQSSFNSIPVGYGRSFAITCKFNM